MDIGFDVPYSISDLESAATREDDVRVLIFQEIGVPE